MIFHPDWRVKLLDNSLYFQFITRPTLHMFLKRPQLKFTSLSSEKWILKEKKKATT